MPRIHVHTAFGVLRRKSFVTGGYFWASPGSGTQFRGFGPSGGEAVEPLDLLLDGIEGAPLTARHPAAQGDEVGG